MSGSRKRVQSTNSDNRDWAKMSSQSNLHVANANAEDVYRARQNMIVSHLTTLAHFCILVFTLYIVYLCFSLPVELFTWHPLLYVIGWALLMTEAVAMISKNNIFSSSMNFKSKVKWHWILQAIAVTFATIGYAVVIVSKNIHNKSHFVTWHANFGLFSMIFCYVTVINGALALYCNELRNYISPRIIKLAHTGTGILTVALGCITLFLSLSTHWFQRRSDEHYGMYIIGAFCIIFGIGWSLLKALGTFWFRIKNNL